MNESRPNPLEALQAAAREGGVTIPDGLLERILELESDPIRRDSDRATVQATLRGFIESIARTAP